jgi:hypothetical protein
MGPGKYEIVRNPDIQPEEVAKHHSIPRAQRFNDKPDPDMVKRPVQVLERTEIISRLLCLSVPAKVNLGDGRAPR